MILTSGNIKSVILDYFDDALKLAHKFPELRHIILKELDEFFDDLKLIIDCCKEELEDEKSSGINKI